MFTPQKKLSKKSSSSQESYLPEKLALFSSLFFIAFGMGLITDGKKLYSHQLKLSQHIDFKSTANPYQ
jgi:hypothetical protein